MAVTLTFSRGRLSGPVTLPRMMSDSWALADAAAPEIRTASARARRRNDTGRSCKKLRIESWRDSAGYTTTCPPGLRKFAGPKGPLNRRGRNGCGPLTIVSLSRLVEFGL